MGKSVALTELRPPNVAPTYADVVPTYTPEIGEHTMAGSPLLPTRDTPSQMMRISTFENTDL